MSTSSSISVNEFKLMRDYIGEHCGIALGDDKAYLIETRLSELMAKNGCDDFGAFYRLVKSRDDPALRDSIIDAMTTNETLWFRDGHPFAILREVILPAFAAQVQKGRAARFRLWSAASSTGQEAYSMAMTIHEFCRTNPALKPAHFEIIGTDVSSSALFLAKAARYDALAVRRGLPENLRERYLKSDGPVWVVNDEIKTMVTFTKFNLQNPLVSLGRFDTIFLRYVAIYFSAEFKTRLFRDLARILDPAGALLLGAVESMRGFNDDFDMMPHAGGFYYAKKKT